MYDLKDSSQHHGRQRTLRALQGAHEKPFLFDPTGRSVRLCESGHLSHSPLDSLTSPYERQTGRLLMDGVSRFHLRGDNSRSGKKSPVCWDTGQLRLQVFCVLLGPLASLFSTWGPGCGAALGCFGQRGIPGCYLSHWECKPFEMENMRILFENVSRILPLILLLFLLLGTLLHCDSWGRHCPSHSALALVRYPYCEGHIHYPKEPK